MASHLLEVKGLETRFFTVEGTVHAVNGISYHLDEGETLAIVGESGCGKTVGVLSLIKLIPDPPGKVTGGEVIFEGLDLTKLKRHQLENVRGNKIGMVFQDPTMSLTPVMPVGRQIAETLIRHKKLGEKAAKEKTIELMELVNIPQAAQRYGDYPHQFSGGVRQRIMIAIAISCMPKLLIADEPTTGLDVTIAAGLLDLVKGLRETIGLSMIWITHDLAVVAGLADRVIVMYAGQIVEEGKVTDIYETAKHPYTEGLLSSIPSVDSDHDSRLKTIGGMPPDLLEIPNQCSFAPRCKYVIDKCWNEQPSLMTVMAGRKSACWLAEKIGD